jgi:hypothetical protein
MQGIGISGCWILASGLARRSFSEVALLVSRYKILDIGSWTLDECGICYVLCVVFHLIYAAHKT